MHRFSGSTSARFPVLPAPAAICLTWLMCAAVALLPASGWAGDGDPRSAGAETDVKAQNESDNLCFGGLEDGKIIVGEQFLQNPYRQTTRLGCEVDGGAPATMPDLPAPDAARHRLA